MRHAKAKSKRAAPSKSEIKADSAKVELQHGSTNNTFIAVR